MKMEERYDSLLIRAIGSTPKLRILDYLLDYKINDFTKKEIIEALGMSKLTFYKYFKDLEALGLVTTTRKIGRATLYKVNLNNPMVKMLVEYETKLSLQIAEKEAREIEQRLSTFLKRKKNQFVNLQDILNVASKKKSR